MRTSSGFDNKIFNVNGDMRDVKRLAATLDIAVSEHDRIVAFKKSSDHGLILYWAECDGVTLFPCPMTSAELLPIVLAYLNSEDAKLVKCEGNDANADHDGENKIGWRVYCEDWGHVGHSWQATIAIKPCYIWFGK